MGITTERVIKTTFQLRRGSAENWNTQNPILRAGEPGFELDTGKLKIGNGTKPWDELDYINVSGGSGGSGEPSTSASIIIDYPCDFEFMSENPIKYHQFELSEPFPLSWAEFKVLIDAQ